jgi:hypothetical protein
MAAGWATLVPSPHKSGSISLGPCPLSYSRPNGRARIGCCWRSGSGCLSGWLGSSRIVASRLAPLEIGTAPMIQNRLAAETHRQMLSQIPVALVQVVLLLVAALLIAIYSFDRRPEYLLLGLWFAANAFGLAVSWLPEYTFLLTVGQTMLVLALLLSLELFLAVYGLWSLLEVPVGRWIKALLFASIPFGSILGWAYEWGGVEARMLDSIAYVIWICLCLTIVMFILWRSRNVAAQTR